MYNTDVEEYLAMAFEVRTQFVFPRYDDVSQSKILSMVNQKRTLFIDHRVIDNIAMIVEKNGLINFIAVNEDKPYVADCIKLDISKEYLAIDVNEDFNYVAEVVKKNNAVMAFNNLYPIYNTKYNTVTTEKGHLFVMEIYCIPTMLSAERLIYTEYYSTMEEAVTHGLNVLSKLCDLNSFIYQWETKDISYIVYQESLYQILGIQPNYVELKEVMFHEEDSPSEFTTIPLIELASNKFYSINDKDIICIDGRVVQDGKDLGSMKAVDNIYAVGRGYKNCLHYQLESKVEVLNELLQKDKPDDITLKTIMILGDNVKELIQEILDTPFMVDIVMLDNFMWMYKGSFKKISVDYLNNITEHIDTLLSETSCELYGDMDELCTEPIDEEYGDMILL